ncbi:poly glycohydrolase family protein [Pelomyxa schiedti]|nr:poly glycohydrolase family protein [Pelomyxa schiedti]
MTDNGNELSAPQPVQEVTPVIAPANVDTTATAAAPDLPTTAPPPPPPPPPPSNSSASSCSHASEHEPSSSASAAFVNMDDRPIEPLVASLLASTTKSEVAERAAAIRERVNHLLAPLRVAARERRPQCSHMWLPCRVPKWWAIITAVLSQPLDTPMKVDAALASLQMAIERDVPNFFFTGLIEEDESPSPIDTKEFMTVTLPFIQKLVLKMSELFPDDIPFLFTKSHITFTREQVACLIISNFFNILLEPKSYTNKHFQSISFSSLFHQCSNPAFPYCLINYFMRIARCMPQGSLTIRRKVLEDAEVPSWDTLATPLCPVVVHEEGLIEESEAVLHADFANEYIGGGVLHGGCVQEEILFVLRPECLLSMFLCPRMELKETITIIGAERFSNYTGYGRRFAYAGNYNEPTNRHNGSGGIITQVVAMDALMAMWLHRGDQFKKPWSERDLNKAYCAFMRIPEDGDGALGPVATGNWGCGAFGGNHQLKFFQQWIAASQSGRSMEYFTFRERFGNAEEIVELRNNPHFNIGTLWTALHTADTSQARVDLFEHIKKVFNTGE